MSRVKTIRFSSPDLSDIYRKLDKELYDCLNRTYLVSNQKAVKYQYLNHTITYDNISQFHCIIIFEIVSV